VTTDTCKRSCSLCLSLSHSMKKKEPCSGVYCVVATSLRLGVCVAVALGIDRRTYCTAFNATETFLVGVRRWNCCLQQLLDDETASAAVAVRGHWSGGHLSGKKMHGQQTCMFCGMHDHGFRLSTSSSFILSFPVSLLDLFSSQQSFVLFCCPGAGIVTQIKRKGGKKMVVKKKGEGKPTTPSLKT
jgi:hypothetical protein